MDGSSPTAGPRRHPQPRAHAARPRRQPRRRRAGPWPRLLAAIGVVAVLVAGFVLVRWAVTPPPAAPGATSSEQALAILTSVPAADLDRVGVGSATPNVIRVPASQVGERPTVLYLGAEYCPYCAAERWPLIVALSRFGTFSGLRSSASSASDAFPRTPTFTFAAGTYSGQYVDFVAVEQDVSGAGKVVLSAAQRDIVRQYGRGGIPFIDIGERAALPGATYTPGLLQGLTQYQVAETLRDPTSAQAQAILGSANLLTAAICLATSERPGEVCSSAGVRAAAAHLG